jgi:hypothetical protein
MNKEWIYNFDNILPTHKDKSDYERYYIFYRKYIEDNIHEHDHIREVLMRSLVKFKNTTLISIAYRLLSLLECQLKIERKVLIDHFKNRSLRRYLYPILKITNEKLSDKRLIRLLYDENYEDPYFFSYISHRRDLLRTFLDKKYDTLLRKQLLVILNTEFYYNMDYFITFIGSKNRHVGFLVYEILTRMVNEEKNFNHSTFKIMKNESETYIELYKKVSVDSIDNFLIYFMCFMKEKSLIMEYIREIKLKEIENILRERYISCNDKLTKLQNLHLYSTDLRNNDKVLDLVFEPIEPDFDFLFKGENYKSISDCIEL